MPPIQQLATGKTLLCSSVVDQEEAVRPAYLGLSWFISCTQNTIYSTSVSLSILPGAHPEMALVVPFVLVKSNVMGGERERRLD
jgi:hypothetical protein